MRLTISAFCLVLIAGLAVAAAQDQPAPKTAAKKKSAAKKPSAGKKSSTHKKSSASASHSGSTSTARKSTAQKSPATKATASSSHRRRSTGKTRRAAAPRGQMHPTAERYKQIEEALAARGYLHDSPSGKWGPGSVEALRSFQADHQLPPTGKLDALSLEQLGLGPTQ
ncbi:MAG TPA: peptidoglycan-binding domain-containing protein [Bryobacterales bacterium]|nr:peptidoglycan-binding domain-containing protein [Bryobacterales bacterium]